MHTQWNNLKANNNKNTKKYKLGLEVLSPGRIDIADRLDRETGNSL